MAQAGVNTLGRLNEVLFAELERLNDLDVTDEAALKAEVERSKAVQGVAKEINMSARSVLDTARLRAKERDHGLLGERLTKDGYREVRIDPRGAKHTMERWIPLGAFNWMAANGREWPGGCKCVHIDGDVANDSADNIEPVPNELWPLLCGAVPGQLEWHDRETLRTAILFAQVTRARVDARRKARIASGRPWASDLRAATSPAACKMD